jgi:hypothetical protein
MSIAPLHKILSIPILQEWLMCSKKLISTVDKTIELTPMRQYPSVKERSLRILFMNARTASFEICILAESLLNNDDHHSSRAIEYSIRLLWETAIDYFYISKSENSVAQRYLDFLTVVNTTDSSERKKIHTDFKKKYKNTERGDFWSGKSREDKTNQGIMKHTKDSRAESFINILKPTFDYLNEQVHGNFVFGSYWTFNKHGENDPEYRKQIASGLLALLLFQLISVDFCRFTGRGSEVEHFRFYNSYIIENFSFENL